GGAAGGRGPRRPDGAGPPGAWTPEPPRPGAPPWGSGSAPPPARYAAPGPAASERSVKPRRSANRTVARILRACGVRASGSVADTRGEDTWGEGRAAPLRLGSQEPAANPRAQQGRLDGAGQGGGRAAPGGLPGPPARPCGAPPAP